MFEYILRDEVYLYLQISRCLSFLFSLILNNCLFIFVYLLLLFRYLGIRNITMLRTQIEQMSAMVNTLKEDKGKLSADITGIQKAIEISIQEIKDNPNIGRAHIETK